MAGVFKGEFLCSACHKTFVGGRCNAFERTDAELDKLLLPDLESVICRQCCEECGENFLISKVGALRQWLNEERIDDPKKMVSNEDLLKWFE